MFNYEPEALIPGYKVFVEHFADGCDFLRRLNELAPSQVILMEPLLHLMRALEVYSAEQKLVAKAGLDEVMIIRYSDSTELYQHMTTIEREKRAFQELLQVQSKISVELPNYTLEPEVQETGRNMKVPREMKKDIIVVDTREFSCLTPIFLAEKGFWLVPMMLTVGDYIISDQICVERKAIYTGDLFSSFTSGRLLQQCENMERYYDKPILLIEFDESIPFRLLDQFQ